MLPLRPSCHGTSGDVDPQLFYHRSGWWTPPGTASRAPKCASALPMTRLAAEADWWVAPETVRLRRSAGGLSRWFGWRRSVGWIVIRSSPKRQLNRGSFSTEVDGEPRRGSFACRSRPVNRAWDWESAPKRLLSVPWLVRLPKQTGESRLRRFVCAEARAGCLGDSVDAEAPVESWFGRRRSDSWIVARFPPKWMVNRAVARSPAEADRWTGPGIESLRRSADGHSRDSFVCRSKPVSRAWDWMRAPKCERLISMTRSFAEANRWVGPEVSSSQPKPKSMPRLPLHHAARPFSRTNGIRCLFL